MARSREDSRDWLEKHLKQLMAIGKKIHEKDAGLPSHPPTYEKGYWTALKLVCLKYYLPVYLNILKSKSWKVAYIDLFSGPGLNTVGDASVPLPGSPLIAVEHVGTRHAFDLYVFGDINGQYIAALEQRLRYYMDSNGCRLYSDQLEVRTANANDLACELPQLLRQHSIRHSLIFADPEGLELKWSTLKFLSEELKYSDWIILFPSAGLNRVMGRADDASWGLVEEFIGPGSEGLRASPSEHDAVELYKSNLASLGKDITTEIAVTGIGSFHYHLIPTVRRTSGDSPWFKNCFEPAKEKLESMDSDVLGIVVEQIEGRQSSLARY